MSIGSTLIATPRLSGVSWLSQRLMCPLPLLISPSTLRIFITFCDASSIGRIGYIDVSRSNPSLILDYSFTPLVDVGPRGTLFDRGVVTSSLYLDNDLLYLFFSGYSQVSPDEPYRINCSYVVSSDLGRTFEPPSYTPLLPFPDSKSLLQSSPQVIKTPNNYLLFFQTDYHSTLSSQSSPLSLRHYSLAYHTCEHFLEPPDSQPAISMMPDLETEQFGITRGTIETNNDNSLLMFYSLRNLGNSYSVRCAEAELDFPTFRDIEGPSLLAGLGMNYWDSSMQCFPSTYHDQEYSYLFYCGNAFGASGFGYIPL